jgi:hypothetical protein
MRLPIQGLDFIISKDSQPFLRRIGRVIFQASSSLEPLAAPIRMYQEVYFLDHCD